MQRCCEDAQLAAPRQACTGEAITHHLSMVMKATEG